MKEACVLVTETRRLSFGLKTSGRALQAASCLHVSAPERRNRLWRPLSDVHQLPDLEEVKNTSQIMKLIRDNTPYQPISVY